MTFRHFSTAVGSLALLGLGLSAGARADDWNKKTTITVNEPIQVPNKVLPAGKYIFKLLNSCWDRNVVQIFNANETELLTTILTRPNYRMKQSDRAFTFWEMPAGHPAALRAWFYPGEEFGQEFTYSKTEAVAITATARVEVPTTAAKAK